MISTVGGLTSSVTHERYMGVVKSVRTIAPISPSAIEPRISHRQLEMIRSSAAKSSPPDSGEVPGSCLTRASGE